MAKKIHYRREKTYYGKPGFYCDISKHDESRMTLEVQKVTCKKCIHMTKRDGIPIQ